MMTRRIAIFFAMLGGLARCLRAVTPTKLRQVFDTWERWNQGTKPIDPNADTYFPRGSTLEAQRADRWKYYQQDAPDFVELGYVTKIYLRKTQAGETVIILSDIDDKRSTIWTVGERTVKSVLGTEDTYFPVRGITLGDPRDPNKKILH